jgi:prevent-host-death family protein
MLSAHLECVGAAEGFEVRADDLADWLAVTVPWREAVVVERSGSLLATLVANSYTRDMSAIPARDLRNHTAEVLRRVEAGEEIEVLRDNRPVAKIIPLSRRRQWLPASEVAHELLRLGPDTTGLAGELREILHDTTDDLPW